MAKDVSGFPTIKIEYDTKRDEYTGARTVCAFLKKLIPNIKQEDLTKWSPECKDSKVGIIQLESNIQKGGLRTFYKYQKYKSKYLDKVEL